MKTKSRNRMRFIFLSAILLFFGPGLFAQSGQGTGGTGAQGSISSGKDNSPLNYDTAMNASSPRENNAFKHFQSVPDSPFEKKAKAGEEFVQKFPDSVYLPEIYSTLTVLYIENGQPEKGFADGEKALALKPNDVRTMANLSQAMARLNNPNDPDAAQKLQKAEQYAQKCIQITPTLPKPAGVSDQDFAAAKDKTLAMAHSALGLVNIRRANYAQAIPDLQEAVRLDGGKDITNLYLLGVANSNSSHYAEALDAFTKCAAAPGKLQQPCRDGAADAKKHVTAKTSSN